jgi:hypothetical protein
MNMIVKFFTERIFIIVFGLAIIVVGIVSPRYALVNLWNTFQRVKFENTYKKF